MVHFKILLLPLLLMAFDPGHSQNIGIGTSNPNASSLLEIRSSSKGLLIPRINLSSENDSTTIASPANFLFIFNTNASLPNGQGFYFWNGAKWVKLVAVPNLNNFSWGLNGNPGNADSNFIGTLDNHPLVFKTNNILSGMIDPGPNNVFWGQGAGSATTGTNNTFLGHQAGSDNTIGIQNTAVGTFALDSNTTGNNNSSFGLSSLRANSIGSNNCALGARALFSSKTANDNTAVGYESSYNNVSGVRDVSIGLHSLFSNTSGNGNIAIGNASLYKATTVNSLVALGDSAMFNNTSGTQNVAVGEDALFANTSGSSNTVVGTQSASLNTSGFGNSAFGNQSMPVNTTGSGNVSVGYLSMRDNTTGSDNTGIGNSALQNNSSGTENTAVGSGAMALMTSGSKNTAIGVISNIDNGVSNGSSIGYNSRVSTSNTMSFGDENVDRWAFGISTTTANHAMEVGSNSTNGNGAYLTQGGTWTNASDLHKKEDFTLLDKKDVLGKINELLITKWKYKGTNEYHIGPVAQDFYGLFGLGTDNKSISTIDPAGIALLAIQELSRENVGLRKENEALSKRLQAIEEILSRELKKHTK